MTKVLVDSYPARRAGIDQQSISRSPAPALRTTTPKQQQGGSTAILMQGWRWDSVAVNNPDWYGVMKNIAADMKAIGMTHVQFLRSSDAEVNSSTGHGKGYLLRQLNILSGQYDTQAEL